MHLMSKIKSELAGISGGAPFFPYASAAGIVRRRSPPGVMPATPTSQPLMTWPTPSLKENGLPFLLAVIPSVPSPQTSQCMLLTVKDLSVLQLSDVAHLDAVALLGSFALTLLLVVDDDAANVAGALCDFLLGLGLGCLNLGER
jgi:hypothetical protein